MNNPLKKVLRLFLPAAALLLAVAMAASCSVARERKKTKAVKSGTYNVGLNLPKERETDFREISFRRDEHEGDTVVVQDVQGNEMILMKAVRDEGSGEMVAHEVLDAAMVTARFRNVAERHGKVDLAFEIRVPKEMIDSKWQLRFNPDMFILEDSIRLAPVIITGAAYRDAQLRGYERYQKFLDSIVTDSTKFINMWQLTEWINRNLPQLAKFEHDTSFVSEEEFRSVFGVDEQMAVEHYTDQFAKSRNRRKELSKDIMYRKYVKAPIESDGIRLDSVYTEGNDFVYQYIQTIETRPRLRKVDIVLSGEIYDLDQLVYAVPNTDKLTFYISSLSAFADETPRYLTKVIGRKVEANSSCYIEFEQGRDVIREDLGENYAEISRIKANIRDVLRNESFDLDSVTLGAFASPEGSVSANGALSERRAAAASRFFKSYTDKAADSLRREEGFYVTVGDSDGGHVERGSGVRSGIPFKSRSLGENWPRLDVLVDTDPKLTVDDKEKYFDYKERYSDFDQREKAMSGESWYGYVRENLYPRTRIVSVDFHLHRRGMVKDTIHTTVIDSVYMEGVQLLKDRDFEEALKRLSTYHDYNTAIAYVALDRNVSAMKILRDLPQEPQVLYMEALVESRWGHDQEAVNNYIAACRLDRKYIARGNLDPEISALVKKYDLLKVIEPEDEYDDVY